MAVVWVGVTEELGEVREEDEKESEREEEEPKESEQKEDEKESDHVYQINRNSNPEILDNQNFMFEFANFWIPENRKTRTRNFSPI